MASTGVASTRMMLVAYMPRRRVAGGTRSCPGARSLWMVTMKFRPVRIEEKPVMKTPAAVART